LTVSSQFSDFFKSNLEVNKNLVEFKCIGFKAFKAAATLL